MKKLALTTILVITIFLAIAGCSSVNSKTNKDNVSLEKIKEVQMKFSESKISAKVVWNEYIDNQPVAKEHLGFTVITGFSALYNISNENHDTLISFFTNEEKQQIAYSIKRQDYKDFLEKKISTNELISKIGNVPQENVIELHSMLIVINAIK